MENLRNLLNQVSIIQKKYDDLAEYSGEHYNVFDILGVNSDELSHSLILANLLNAKGKHGQKDLFLRLFIDQIKNKFNKNSKYDVLCNFSANLSNALTEKNTGKVDYLNEEGGRIDIIINDGKNNIIIENKIYAGDQPLQLLRYNKYDKEAPILYLTLEGLSPSEDSKKGLIDGENFICISFKNDISTWLEYCIKEMANKPIIRETLNQYLYLIKELTNQTNNKKMKDEITSIILNNETSFSSFIELCLVKNELLPIIFEQKLFPLLQRLSTKYNLELSIDREGFLNQNRKWNSFGFTNNLLARNNLVICFAFNVTSGFRELIFGFVYKNHELKNDFNYIPIKENFKKVYTDTKETNGWPCFKYHNKYRNWEDLNTMKNILFSDFEEDIEEKVASLLEILNTSY